MLGGKSGTAAILGIGTALPPHRVGQEEAAERVVAALSGGRALASGAKANRKIAGTTGDQEHGAAGQDEGSASDRGRVAAVGQVEGSGCERVHGEAGQAEGNAGDREHGEAEQAQGSTSDRGRAMVAGQMEGSVAWSGEHTTAAKWVRRLFRQCAVDTRHVCDPVPAMALTTAERGRVYREHALPLAMAAARRALADAGIGARDITHVLAVSCTGLYLPGLDVELVRNLGIARDAVRMPLSFAGCAAGLRAVSMAKELAERGDADASVLVVCVELCTLHVQPLERRNELLAAALFGDGASACVVGAAPAAKSGGGNSGRRRGLFTLGACRSVLLPEGERDMTWTVGDTGYELVLSPRIPELLCQYLPEELAQLEDGAGERARAVAGSAASDVQPLAESVSGRNDQSPTEYSPERSGRSLTENRSGRSDRLSAGLAHSEGLWAIHPGGRSILDAVQRLYGLSDEQLRPSREVLRCCGNMSSATILFVLERMRAELEEGGAEETDGSVREDGQARSGVRQGVALAFGPGLTAELQQFSYVPPSALGGIDDVEKRAGKSRPGAGGLTRGDDFASQEAVGVPSPIAHTYGMKATAE